MTSKEELPSNPHRLVAAWIEREKQARSAARSRGWTVHAGLDQTDSGKRVFQMHDAILKAGEARGYAAEIPKDSRDPLGFAIRGEHVSWRIREGYRRRKVPLSKAELNTPFNLATGTTTKTLDEPSGALIVFLNARYNIEKRIDDTPRKPLKNRMGEILDWMDAAAAHAAARREEDNLTWRRRIDEQGRRQRLGTLIKREERRWSRLRQVTADRGEVERLLETVAAVRKRMSDGGIDTPRVEAWLQWAEGRIAGLDLMRREPEAIFNRLIARSKALTEYEREFGEEEPDDE